MQEAAKCMSSRQNDALRHLEDICDSGSVSEHSRALQAATSCGVEAVLVAKQKQLWDSRCSAVAQELSDAVHATDFSAGDFSSSQQKVRAQSLYACCCNHCAATFFTRSQWQRVNPPLPPSINWSCFHAISCCECRLRIWDWMTRCRQPAAI